MVISRRGSESNKIPFGRRFSLSADSDLSSFRCDNYHSSKRLSSFSSNNLHSLSSGIIRQVFLGFTPGAVGGTCAVLVGHPIDLVKVRMQTSLQTPLSTTRLLRQIFVSEGVRGLYAGVTAPLLAVTPAFAISFYAYDFAKRQLTHYNERTYKEINPPLSTAQIGVAGGFSGLPLAFVLGPLERIKCLMQVDLARFSGFFDCVRYVLKEGGLRSVFQGTGMTMVRDVPGNAAYFSGYEAFRRLFCYLEDRTTPSSVGLLFSGGMAGALNWIVAIPFDTVKSRWQTAPKGTYSSALDVARQTLATEGAKGFFRGMGPAIGRAFPANAACILGVETVRGFLDQ